MDEKYLRMMLEEPSLFKNISGGIDIITNPSQIKIIENEHNTNIGIMYEDEYIILLKDAVRFADKKTGLYIRVYHKNRGGVSVLVTCDDKILLLKHFRHSMRQWLWETPRGFADAGETSEESAVREMKEEIGIGVSDIEYIGNLVPDAGIIGEPISIYLAKIKGNENIVTELHEGIQEIKWFSKDEINKAIATGEIVDGITISSITLATLREKL